MSNIHPSELAKGPGSCLVLGNTEDIETDSLRQRPALTNSDNIANIDTESRGDVGSQVLVTLLVTVCTGALRDPRLP